MDYTRDTDPVETQEWLDSLDGVIEVEGPERAHYLLDQLIDGARRRGAPVPYSANTPYLNTIPPDKQEPHPGRPRDRAPHPLLHPLERARDRAARQQGLSELGGHIASFQSAATLYDVGFNALLARALEQARRRPRLHPGPLLARHLRARLPRGAAHRGAAAQLPPGGRRQGPVVLSAPVADAGLLAVPDGVDGPRPADGDLSGALPQVPARPRPRRHREPQGLGFHGRRRDGRAGVASARSRLAGARSSTT